MISNLYNNEILFNSECFHTSKLFFLNPFNPSRILRGLFEGFCRKGYPRKLEIRIRDSLCDIQKRLLRRLRCHKLNLNDSKTESFKFEL